MTRGLGLLALLACAAASAGCDDGAEREAEAARATCIDVAEALASRCPGGSADEVAETLECEWAVAIRDRESLYDECIPALQALPCGAAGPAPVSCEDQIVQR